MISRCCGAAAGIQYIDGVCSQPTVLGGAGAMLAHPLEPFGLEPPRPRRSANDLLTQVAEKKGESP
jgi:hypothetical protein